jgi:hypothetical protein
LTRAREHTHLYASSDQLELPVQRHEAIVVLAERLGRSEPDVPSIRVPLAHERHVEREHVQLTLPLDLEQPGGSITRLRGERDRLQATVDSYPRDAADRVDLFERDVERFRASSENWGREAQRARGELAALGPIARRGKHAAELSLQINTSDRRAADACDAERNAAAKLAEIQNGPESPQRWEADYPDARERLREADQAFKDAVRREADRAITSPGEHLTRVLGEPPGQDQPVERAAWEHATRAVEAYRVTYEIDPAEPTALGGEPGRREARGQKHIDWRTAGKHVLDAREQLDLERPGHGATEERMARVEGLMPEHARDQVLDRSHGWER